MRLLRGADVETVGTLEAFATFSVNGHYRYVLGRVWDSSAPLMVWCMLNPSTATEKKLDPTLVRVRGFAQRDHFGGFLVVNCFAWRATDRSSLRRVPYPIGPRNDAAIKAALTWPLVTRAVAGWGRPDTEKIDQRMAAVKQLVLSSGRRWWALGTTKQGYPRHPLYLKKTAELVPLSRV